MSRGVRGHPTGAHEARSYILAIFSGFLLTLAFPRWNLWPLAWAALIPLFHALEKARSRKQAFIFGFTAGFVFFLLSLSWLRHVTVFGLFFVAAMQTAYWGVFGLVSFETQRAGKRLAPAILLPAVWVALEFIRSEIPVWGFGWNLLGYSQAPNLWIAQLASLIGAYGVGFLVFLGNAVLYSVIRRGKSELRTAFLFLLLIGAGLLFGWSRMVSAAGEPRFRVTVLQGNIPQLLKWDPAYREQILKIYLNLTELAGYDRPQLIVWPEAAYPGFFNRELEAGRVRALVRKIETPLLVGSPHQEDDGFFNSAYLLDRSGDTLQRYDKIRLVPFGEYVPWKPVFGFLERYAYSLGVGDFNAGREWTVFGLGESGPKFSVLVCFEDIFPGVARKFVGQGADFLTVITNDAWFGRSSAPYQHLQASIFRAIENGVSVVRAANSGVSGFITPEGRVAERVKNQEGKDTFVMGGMTYPVVWAKEKTFYRRGGWIFPVVCLAGVLVAGIFQRKESR
ncbi:MAG: apolipoprotein N-acyltransferase [Candidatus Omnitrophica bacterium]|nr:apolipoprotein N-acyltransferase [Candidatus Omnitrophota bacterium]